jgi:Na+-translocating ferredoxin:NAD+ oxidoreductase subunit B
MAYLITENCRGCQACVRPCPTQAITGERHAVHHIDPKRCIECGTCGRVCPYAAVLTAQGSVAQRIKKMDWPKPVIDLKVCVSCGLCITICPVSCLALVYFQEGSTARGYPELAQPKACIACGFCAEICPVEAISMRATKRSNKD